MSVEINWTCRRFDELRTDELYQILQLRAEVFVVEQDCVYQDVDGFDQLALHVMGRLPRDDEASLVSYTRLLPPGVKYEEAASIGRVVTRETARGAGSGKALMQYSISICQENWPGTAIVISAQQYLEKFYVALGFVTETEAYAEDGIPHIRMRLAP